MASAAEQLASNINFGSIGKAEELKKRIWFTLGALIVFRLGTYIPLPGIDTEALRQSFQQASGGVLGLFNMFSGGAVERMAIFALNIMPYISASIIVQLLTSVVPSLEALKKEGESGRKVINQYTRYITVILALFQSYGIAVGLQSSGNIVTDPGPFFLVSTVITLTGGTLFLMWLGEQITSRGIGNGSSLIIFAGIVAHLPSAAAGTLELGRQGAISTGIILGVIVMAVAVICFIVFMERAQRRLLINYPKRQVGNKMYEGQTSFLPLKLNTAGVIPPIFASSLLLLPATFASFSTNQGGTGIVATLAAFLGHDRVQSAGDGRQPEEAWWLHPRHPAWRAHRRDDRLRADPHHGDRCGLPHDHLPFARTSRLICGASLLFRWHLAADRGVGHDGYGGAGSRPSPRPSV
jgi:preprotein translocase subunit SecY